MKIASVAVTAADNTVKANGLGFRDYIFAVTFNRGGVAHSV
jgi:hypothetical protein